MPSRSGATTAKPASVSDLHRRHDLAVLEQARLPLRVDPDHGLLAGELRPEHAAAGHRVLLVRAAEDRAVHRQRRPASIRSGPARTAISFGSSLFTITRSAVPTTRLNSFRLAASFGVSFAICSSLAFVIASRSFGASSSSFGRGCFVVEDGQFLRRHAA